MYNGLWAEQRRMRLYVSNLGLENRWLPGKNLHRKASKIPILLWRWDETEVGQYLKSRAKPRPVRGFRRALRLSRTTVNARLVYRPASTGAHPRLRFASIAQIRCCRLRCPFLPLTEVREARADGQNRCLGSLGQLGFCTTAGKASFRDNQGIIFVRRPSSEVIGLPLFTTGSKGYNCASPTLDCDIIAGSISQCPISSFPFTSLDRLTPPSNTSTNSSNAPPPTPPTIDTVKGWKYIGCYGDNIKDRILVGYAFRDTRMTVQRCARICGGKNYHFFGVEYSNECVRPLLTFFHALTLLPFATNTLKYRGSRTILRQHEREYPDTMQTRTACAPWLTHSFKQVLLRQFPIALNEAGAR